MNKKSLCIFLCFFSVLYASEKVVSESSSTQAVLQERLPYVIQDKKYPVGFKIIFYKYNWIIIDGGLVGFLKPEYDTNPDEIDESRREP